MSTQKGGIATMPPLIPTISILSSPKNNWCCPLELQLSFLQYSKPCPWWTLNNSTPTSALPYPPTPLHLFTTNPRNLTHDGLWTPMVPSEEIIYMLDSKDLWLWVLHYKHDHPTAGHFGQNKTINLVWCKYTWPRLHDFVKDFVSPVLVAIMLRLLIIDPTEVWNNFWSWRSHGTPFQWTS